MKLPESHHRTASVWPEVLLTQFGQHEPRPRCDRSQEMRLDGLEKCSVYANCEEPLLRYRGDLAFIFSRGKGEKMTYDTYLKLVLAGNLYVFRRRGF